MNGLVIELELKPHQWTLSETDLLTIFFRKITTVFCNGGLVEVSQPEGIARIQNAVALHHPVKLRCPMCKSILDEVPTITKVTPTST